MGSSEVLAYLNGTFRSINGWCSPFLWQVIEPISDIQSGKNVTGPVAEIGVHHGKFFIGLVKTKMVANNYAIDVFSQQEFNLDESGRGNLDVFRKSLEISGVADRDVNILERDSMSFSDQELFDIRNSSGGFTMFSIDGCHMVEHTIGDSKTAMKLTLPEGIIFVDDYYNANWPGVQEGICKLYLLESPRFIPLAVVSGKLILCHISFHSEYLRGLLDFIPVHFPESRIKGVKRFGYDTLTIIPDQTGNSYVSKSSNEIAH